MEQDSPNRSGFERFNEWRNTSLTLKLVTIGFIVLLMLIPNALVQDLIRERQWRKNEAVNEVSSTWGGAQVVNGPVLSIPFYTYETVSVSGSPTSTRQRVIHYAHFLPEQLDIQSTVDPMKRKRGIYEVLVYNSEIQIDGKFVRPDFSGWPDVESILWEGAFVSIGIPDMRAIRDNIVINWNGADSTMSPGVDGADIFASGVSAHIPVDPQTGEITFSTHIKLGGNSSLQFVPLGKETNLKMTSSWSSPKFIGAFLPSPEANISANGFEANWKVLHLNRNFPQRFIGYDDSIDESAFGTELLIMVNEYQKNERSAKYAVLLISLTFLVFFFIQALNKVRIHTMQYILVGLALSLFYVLLLSFSEQIGFNNAYIVACVSTVTLVTLYFKSITASWKLSGFLTFILLFVYAFIFIIIQLEDLALLAGSIGLFIILSIVMYLSRKVDWYALGKR